MICCVWYVCSTENICLGESENPGTTPMQAMNGSRFGGFQLEYYSHNIYVMGHLFSCP